MSTVATVAGLVAVGVSSHEQELEGFVGFALSVAGVAAGWIGWVLLVGHDRTATTESVYRHEIRPALTQGAEVMDEVFG